jgi:3-phenylpropionate/cinnamic acid dioxygenase small subunit
MSQPQLSQLHRTLDYTLTERIPSSHETYCQLQDFLIDEIELLDGDQLTGWLDLLDDGIFYHAPVRITRLRGKGEQFHRDMNWFHETKPSLSFKIKRFEETGSAWAGDPAPRVRRLMTNVVVHKTDVDGLFQVTSNILLSISRGNEFTVDTVTAKRLDLISTETQTLKITRRTIYLDHTILGVPSLSFFI